MIFDSPGSNVCLAQRNRSNTPLQALTTLNDPVFFECAQALGHQLAGATTPPTDRIQHAALTALSRPMTFKELRILTQLHTDELQWFSQHPDDASQVAGNTILNNTTPATTAAWISVARTLLNLDEFLTRQ
jgi:hypothetical protein